MTILIELEFDEHGEENIYLKDEKGTRYFFKDTEGFLNNRPATTRAASNAPPKIQLTKEEMDINLNAAYHQGADDEREILLGEKPEED